MRERGRKKEKVAHTEWRSETEIKREWEKKQRERERERWKGRCKITFTNPNGSIDGWLCSGSKRVNPVSGFLNPTSGRVNPVLWSELDWAGSSFSEGFPFDSSSEIRDILRSEN